MRSFYPVLALLTIEGIGCRECFNLPDDHELAFDMLKSDSGREELSSLLGRAIPPVDWRAFSLQLDAMERTGATAIAFYDEVYPSYLLHISEPPPLLIVQGDPSTLAQRGVAIVGTRKPSPRGAQFARSLALELSTAGTAVVSGLARGIDTAAHEGSLSGPGRAVGVMGSGIDVPYPVENADLMESIMSEGCLVSEQLMGTPPRRHAFPRRNRLISAFSQAVVVVEAGEKSGALITARWALEQGREVGAVPGFPGDFRSRGVNSLLKQGAFLVEGAEDVLMAVPLLAGAHRFADRAERESREAHPPVDSERRRPDALEKVLDALSKEPADQDSLAELLDIPPRRVNALLSLLEVEGKIARDGSGCYYRKGS